MWFLLNNIYLVLCRPPLKYCCYEEFFWPCVPGDQEEIPPLPDTRHILAYVVSLSLQFPFPVYCSPFLGKISVFSLMTATIFAHVGPSWAISWADCWPSWENCPPLLSTCSTNRWSYHARWSPKSEHRVLPFQTASSASFQYICVNDPKKTVIGQSCLFLAISQSCNLFPIEQRA